MSCPRNRDCSFRPEKKDDRSSNCKSTCPGRKKRLPEEIICPYQSNAGTVSREERCVAQCSQTKSTVIKVSSCALSTGCHGPIVIETPKDSKQSKTDIRIELYIHQLPPRDGSHNAEKSNVTRSNDSEGSRRKSDANRSVGSSQQNNADQSNERSRKSDAKSPNSSKDFGGSRRRSSEKKFSIGRGSQQNETQDPHEDSRKNVGRSPENDEEEKKSEGSSSSSKYGESRIRNDGNRPSVESDSRQDESDRRKEELGNQELPAIVITEEGEKDKNFSPREAATNELSATPISTSQNDIVVQESIGVERASQLESAPQRPPQTVSLIPGPGSDVGPNYNGRVNMATDTEEDGNKIRIIILANDMVDESTQVQNG